LLSECSVKVGDLYDVMPLTMKYGGNYHRAQWANYIFRPND